MSQAALKLIRARGYTDNPTPVDRDEALYNLEEEFEDMLAVYAALAGSYETVKILLRDSETRDKWQRWVQRVKAGKEVHQ